MSQKNDSCKKFKLSKWLIVVNETSDFFQVILYRLSIIRTDTSTDSQSMKMTIKGWNDESWLDTFNRIYAIFTLIFEMKVIRAYDWQVSYEVSTYCLPTVAILILEIFTCNIFMVKANIDKIFESYPKPRHRDRF